MKYTTTLTYEARDKLKKNIPGLIPGLYLLDMDPRADKILLGPFDSVSEAHANRDYIWNYGDMYGRYLWLLNERGAAVLKMKADNIEYLEIRVDTLPLEITSMKVKFEGQHGWIALPKTKIKQ